MRFPHSFLVLFLTLISPSVSLLASCGAASCPIDTTMSHHADKGWMRLDYSYEYINQDQPMIGREKASVGEIRGHHDEVSTLSQIQRLGLETGFTDRLSIGVSLPFVHREHQHIHHHGGADIRDDWNFSGMGDATLLAKYAFTKGGAEATRVSAIVGGVLPTGRDEAVNAAGSEAEVGILPGKGAYSLLLGASAVRSITAKTATGSYATCPLFVSSTYQWNEDGPDDYRMGNTLIVNAGATYPLLNRVGVIAQANFLVARKDHAGNTSEEIEKTGGTYLYLSPGIQLGLADHLWANFIVQLPVYQRVNSIQLTSDHNVIMSLSYSFSAL
jgi:hypothetical protein